MNGRHFFIQCTAKWRLWFHQESIFCQDVTNFLATSFYGKKLLNWRRQQSAQWNTEQSIKVSGSFGIED